MAKAYPDSLQFIGLNKPVGKQWDETGLAVEGVIPAEVRGAFYRAVPDPAFAPFVENDHVLSGDGMVSKFHFKADGTVDAAIRFVGTARHLAEVKAGRALFGKYRNPYTDDPSVKGVDRTVANTTPVWHAGKLLMTKEDGRPYRVDPHNLETIGSYDFDGALRSETMTAHVRIDPDTRQMFFFGYEADGLCGTKVAYCIADPSGKLVREQWFDAPYCGMMHDFTVTENYALFPVYPTTSNLERVKAGGEHWIHEPELNAWLGVMPRHGDVAEIKWFRGPKGVSAYHFLNAFETPDGQVHIDSCLSSTQMFPFIREASGIHLDPRAISGGLVRWSVDPAGPAGDVAERPLGPPGDMPRIPDSVQGRPYAHGWYLTMNPQMQGPPLIGGPVGACFNMLVRIEPETGRIDAMPLPPGHAINEPVHIPAAEPGHEGWLMMVVDRQAGPDAFEHEIWIVDGGRIGAGPVAKVKVPHRLRPQVHGWWVPQAELDAA